MGVIAKGILRGCQGLFTPVSLGYPLFNKNSTLKGRKRKEKDNHRKKQIISPVMKLGLQNTLTKKDRNARFAFQTKNLHC